MDLKTLELFDGERNLIIIAQVIERKNDKVFAIITKDLMPPETRDIFSEFEDLVNDQILSLIDDIENKIDKLEISIGPNFIKIKDVQIFEANLTFRIEN